MKPTLPLYCVFDLLHGVNGDPQGYSEFVNHPEHGLFSAVPDVTAADINVWVKQLPSISADTIYSAIFNNERLQLDGVPRIEARWLCDPIQSVRFIDGVTVITSGHKTIKVPTNLMRPPEIKGDPIKVVSMLSLIALDFADQGFFSCSDAVGLVKLRRYLVQNRIYEAQEGVLL